MELDGERVFSSFSLAIILPQDVMADRELLVLQSPKQGCSSRQSALETSPGAT